MGNPRRFIESMLSREGQLRKKEGRERKQGRDVVSAVSSLSLDPPGAPEY